MPALSHCNSLLLRVCELVIISFVYIYLEHFRFIMISLLKLLDSSCYSQTPTPWWTAHSLGHVL